MRAGALYRFNTEKGSYFYIAGQDSQHPDIHLHISYLYEDSQQNLWAATFEKGLMRYDAQQNSLVDEPDENTFVNTIVEDFLPEGNIFFLAWQKRNSIYLSSGK